MPHRSDEQDGLYVVGGSLLLAAAGALTIGKFWTSGKMVLATTLERRQAELDDLRRETLTASRQLHVHIAEQFTERLLARNCGPTRLIYEYLDDGDPAAGRAPEERGLDETPVHVGSESDRSPSDSKGETGVAAIAARDFLAPLEDDEQPGADDPAPDHVIVTIRPAPGPGAPALDAQGAPVRFT